MYQYKDINLLGVGLETTSKVNAAILISKCSVLLIKIGQYTG